MRRKCFPRHRLQRKPLVTDPCMHHGTCMPHVSWCMSGSLTRDGGERVPGIPGACTTRTFAYLVRGLCVRIVLIQHGLSELHLIMIASDEYWCGFIFLSHFNWQWSLYLLYVVSEWEYKSLYWWLYSKRTACHYVFCVALCPWAHRITNRIFYIWKEKYYDSSCKWILKSLNKRLIPFRWWSISQTASALSVIFLVMSRVWTSIH